MSRAALAAALQEKASRCQTDPLRYFRPTPPQEEWLQDPSQVKLFRAANQVGKTWSGAAELLYRMLGTHPYLKTHTPPIEAWVICHSWEQSVDVQAKIWALTPRDQLAEGCEFVEGKGFRGKTPIIRFKNGSICRIKTTNQGSLGVASATLHYVWIDEPPPPEIWGELNARVLRHRGVIGLTMTPIGRPVKWLKEKVEEGLISDHRFSLTPENCTPRGGRPFIQPEEIARMERIYLPIEIRQRVHGEWEGATIGRLFQKFSDDMVRDPLLDMQARTGPISVGIGIDHGADAGSQVAILVFVDRHTGEHPKVWCVDEYTSDGTTTPEHDAKGILQMLARCGLNTSNVDRWVGDRAYGGKRWGGGKSNRLLEEAFSREMRLPVGQLPFRIRTAYKPRGSVFVGARVLHAAMMRGDFVVSPRCEQLVDSLRHWDGRDDEYKHAIDALRYGAVKLMTKSLHVPTGIRIR